MSLVLLIQMAVLVAAPPKMPGLVIRPEALNAQAARAVIVDARDWQQYEESHLPGAISVPWIELAQMPKSPLARSPVEMAEILTSRGIPSDSWVVIYGAGQDGFGEEGRLFWSLSFLGHQKLSVLDGGIAAWKRANFPVTTEGPATPKKKFRSAANPSLRIDKAALSGALSAKAVTLIDVRDRDEFDGARKYGEPRVGHIPGAISLPWKQFFAQDGSLLTKSELLKVLAGQGISINTPLVVYCTGGVRSGFAFLALKVAGATSVANYDGSFWEWASDPALPVTTK